MKKRIIQMTFLAVMLTLLTGCLFKPVEDLYCLPEKLPGSESLMAEITRVRRELDLTSAGVEYANIYSGDNTTTIQMHDMDGDGERETAVTFFNVPEAEQPIQIYFFTPTDEDTYQVSGCITGEGSAIYAVDFLPLNDDEKKEVVVSWQTRGVYQLGVYTFDANRGTVESNLKPSDDKLQATQLLNTGYNSYCLADINQSGRSELIIGFVDPAGVNSYVEVYGWRDGGLELMDSEAISSGITVMSRIRANFVSDFVPAIYISSTLMDGARATDILTYTENGLTNITMNAETGMSVETIREYGDVSATDINSDGILELPRPKSLPTYGDTPTSNFWLIEWSQYNVDGKAVPVYTTYHNVTDGWYLIIPDEWVDHITISRDDSISGQRTVIFSRWNGSEVEPTPFLSIYKLTGPNRFTRADLPGRFDLGEDTTTIYSAAFFDTAWDCGLTDIELIQNFRNIISSWDSN